MEIELDRGPLIAKPNVRYWWWVQLVTATPLPGMSDGSVTVVDLQKQEVVKSMDTLKDAGFNPNCIVLLPAWYNAAGH